jgi:hypothetical protein
MRQSGFCATSQGTRRCLPCPSTSLCTRRWCPTSRWWTCQVSCAVHRGGYAQRLLQLEWGQQQRCSSTSNGN